MLASYTTSVVQLVGGSTASSVWKYYPYNSTTDSPTVFIDVSNLSELKYITESTSYLEFGAAITLNQIIDTLQTYVDSSSKDTRNFVPLINHLKIVASPLIRDAATWAGNLVLAATHPQFPSDVLCMMTAVGALIDISTSTSDTWVAADGLMSRGGVKNNEVLKGIRIPFAQSNEYFDSWKCTIRHTNSHAVINAAFKFTFSSSLKKEETKKTKEETKKIKEDESSDDEWEHISLDEIEGDKKKEKKEKKEKDGKEDATPMITNAIILIGGINPGLLYPTNTMTFLAGQPLSLDTMNKAIALLDQECIPKPDPDETTYVIYNPNYRRSLGTTLFYKFFLNLLTTVPNPPVVLPPEYASTYPHYVRPLSSGTQVFFSDDSEAPVSEPIHKLEGLIQASGEAQYVGDIRNPTGGLYGAYVLSTIARGTITSIDVSTALTMPGVVDFISAKDVADIGGSNNCGDFPGDEEIFATDQIICDGQSIGMIVADTSAHAEAAAKQVMVKYAQSDPPILTIEDAIAAGSYFVDNEYQKLTPSEIINGDVNKGFDASDVVLTGSLTYNTQAHFYMETQCALAIPEENESIRVQASTQGPADLRHTLAMALNLPNNKIICETKRAGGGFGGKLTRCWPIAAAVSVAARKLKKPVRTQLTRQEDFTMIGKRHVFRGDYKVGFNKDGTINALQITFYANGGCTYEETFGVMEMCLLWADNCYNIPNYSIQGICCKTNLPTNTSMRAPGALQGITMVENILENVAYALKADPKAIREKNFYTTGSITPYLQPIGPLTLSQVWTQLQSQVDYPTRVQEVATFNSSNRWRKRGCRLTPVKYGISPGQYWEAILLNIMDQDGTVQLTHSGCEIGQGINTKVAQVVAKELGIPIETIVITTTSTEKVPNFTMTGGSGTSEAVCQAAIDACNQINARLAPFKTANPTATWPELISIAASSQCNLSVTGHTPLSSTTTPFSYYVWCAAFSEVEIDVLTGDVEILRTDIVYDCGQSLSPLIDIGQIEGAFVQGIGFFFTEDVITNKDGKLVTAGTWDYKPPGSKDIPIEFNVTFLKDTPNTGPDNVLGSKASAEPPFMLASSALFAVKDAVAAARSEIGVTTAFDLPVPATTVDIQLACLVSASQLTVE